MWASVPGASVTLELVNLAVMFESAPVAVIPLTLRPSFSGLPDASANVRGTVAVPSAPSSKEDWGSDSERLGALLSGTTSPMASPPISTYHSLPSGPSATEYTPAIVVLQHWTGYSVMTPAVGMNSAILLP